jgi:hypothetical protein
LHRVREIYLALIMLTHQQCFAKGILRPPRVIQWLKMKHSGDAPYASPWVKPRHRRNLSRVHCRNLAGRTALPSCTDILKEPYTVKSRILFCLLFGLFSRLDRMLGPLPIASM